LQNSQKAWSEKSIQYQFFGICVLSIGNPDKINPFFQVLQIECIQIVQFACLHTFTAYIGYADPAAG
jgi:hypothetical protein